MSFNTSISTDTFFKNKTFPTAILFCCSDADTSAQIAADTAKKIVGSNKNNHPDVAVFDCSQQISVADFKSKVVFDAHTKPNQGDNKVYVLLNSTGLSPHCQNSLLKVIETPPLGVHFILTAGNTQLLLSTIKSRCVEYIIPTATKVVNETDFFSLSHGDMLVTLIGFKTRDSLLLFIESLTSALQSQLLGRAEYIKGSDTSSILSLLEDLAFTKSCLQNNSNITTTVNYLHSKIVFYC